MIVPDEREFLECFNSEPIERSPEDGFWCYRFDDSRGVRLFFSFDTHMDSVRTALGFGGDDVASVYCEGCRSINIEDDWITCQFVQPGVETTLTVRLNGDISVDWHSLRSA